MGERREDMTTITPLGTITHTEERREDTLSAIPTHNLNNHTMEERREDTQHNIMSHQYLLPRDTFHHQNMLEREDTRMKKSSRTTRNDLPTSRPFSNAVFSR